MKKQPQRSRFNVGRLADRPASLPELFLVSLTFLGIHLFVFYMGHPIVGSAIAGFILLPVVLLAWFYGLKAGLAAAIAAFFINSLIFYRNDPDSTAGLMLIGTPGHILALFIALIVGRFRDQRVTLKKELHYREQVEQALHDNQIFYEGILNSSLIGIMALRAVRDEPGKICDFEWVLANPTAANLMEKSATDLVGKRLLDEMPVSEENGLFEAYVNIVETGEPYINEYSYKYESGEKVDWFRIQAVKFEDGFVATLTKITRQKQAELALIKSENRYRLISENLNDLICLHQLDGTLAFLSSSIDMLGYTAEELVGKKPYHLFHPDDMKQFRSTDYLKVIQQDQDFTIEGRLRHKEGHYLWVESRIRPFAAEYDDKIYWQSITRDVSEGKAREAALQKAKEEAEEATRAKSDFLANMSHEIRTPMNAIIGLTSLLLETPLNSEQKDFLETVRLSGDSLLEIINGILDFSKIEAGKLELENVPFNLYECVEDALDIIAADAGRKGLELAYLIDDSIPKILKGDMTRLRQILVNLLSNAVKFTSRGEIFLSVTQFPSQTTKRELRFSVLDTGIGIPSDRMNRLFKPFSQVDSSTTRQFGGTGLGLIISKRLAETMGGRMWVESEPGKGSTFSFTIQAEAVAIEEVDMPETAAAANALAGKRILVVDDNDVNRLILKHYLVRWQTDSHLVASGEDALKLLAQGETFDLGILDMQMPNMDGVMLAKAIQAEPHQRPFPLILLSSMGNLTDKTAGDLFAFSIVKPVKPKALFTVLNKFFTTAAPLKVTEKTAETPPEKSPQLHTHLRILLAEDNTINQKVALRMLDRLGYTANLAKNGKEVLAALQKQPYDIILMDVQMPEMDGLAATQQIRANNNGNRQPYIIALTANALKGDRERFLEAGMNAYLSKPVRLEALAEALENCAAELYSL